MEKLEDVIKLISSSDGYFYVSRSKLSCASLYYERLICSGMKDANTSELILPYLSSDGLGAVAEYLQTGSIPGLNNIADASCLERLTNILEAGSYLQIDGLLCLCKEYLTSVVSIQLWKPVLDLASDYYLQDLKVFVQKYLCENFSDCSKTRDFLLLSKDNVLAVLDSDEANADEQEIFNAALSWILFDENRSAYASGVFDTVRFSLMTDIEIKNCMQTLSTHDLVDACMQISEVQSLRNDPQLICTAANQKSKPRCTIRAVLATGGFTSKVSPYSTKEIPYTRLLVNSSISRSVIFGEK